MFKKLLQLCSVMCFFLAYEAHAGKIKISTAYPDGTNVVKSLKAAGDVITEKTEGRVILKIYPGGVQGDNKTVLKKIKRGMLQGALVEGGAMSGEFKDSQVYNAPMLFQSLDEVDYVRAVIDKEIVQGFDNAGWKVFGLIDGGFAYAMTNTEVKTLDELKKQKLWLPANDPLSEKVANALGLSPIYLGIGEVLTALQTGAVNAIAAPPTAALTLQWYSKVKYVTNVPFMYTYGTLALSDEAFKKISADDAKIVSSELTKTITKIDADTRKDNVKAFEALKTQGLVIVTPEESQAKLLKTNAKTATQLLVSQGEFSSDILSRVVKLLDEYRHK